MSTTLRISPAEVKRRIDAGERVTLLDSRAPAQWAASPTKLPDAIRVPLDEIESHLGEIPRDGLVVAYCT